MEEQEAPLVTVEVTPEPEENPAELETPAGEETETLAEAMTETAETQADSAVAIAEIQANAEVAQTAIHADVELARIEADRERNDETWQRLATLENQVQTLTETIQQLSILQPSQEATEIAAAEAAAELAEEAMETEQEDLTLLSMSDGTSETQTEVTVESGEERPVTARAKIKRVAI